MKRLVGVWGSPKSWSDFAKARGYQEVWLYVPYDNWNGVTTGEVDGVRFLFIPVVGAEDLEALQELANAKDVKMVAITDEWIPPEVNAPYVVRKALEMLTSAGKKVIWTRPGLWYVKNGPNLLGLEYYIDALVGIDPNGVLIEDNPRFILPPPSVPAILAEELGFSMIPGTDAYRPEDIPVRTILPVFLSASEAD